VESVYTALTLVFFQGTENFPGEWYRQIFFFLMPILGLAFLGLGAAEFAVLLFNRQSRQAQWEVALASTYRRHIIVCGLGHVGIRVVRELVALGEDNIVIIERDPQLSRVEECKAYGIPVVQGDALLTETLRDAGVQRAEAYIVCTNDDLLNLQIAMTVRDVSPDIRLVVRMFNDAFGRQLGEQLGFDNVFSASALAAPIFAGAATGTAVTQTFYVEDELMNMSRLRVQANCRLAGAAVGDLERDLDLSVVLHQRDKDVDLHPTPEIMLRADDLIVVFANLAGLAELRKRNRPARRF
jgi:Trk K+ transport system NAD-binding subunit